jgi:hypothetical protein
MIDSWQWQGDKPVARSEAGFALPDNALWRQDNFQRRGIMDFRPLGETERGQLMEALRGNANSGQAILMDRRDTSFTGTAKEIPEEEVITAIASVPCHY